MDTHRIGATTALALQYLGSLATLSALMFTPGEYLADGLGATGAGMRATLAACCAAGTAAVLALCAARLPARSLSRAGAGVALACGALACVGEATGAGASTAGGAWDGLSLALLGAGCAAGLHPASCAAARMRTMDAAGAIALASVVATMVDAAASFALFNDAARRALLGAVLAASAGVSLARARLAVDRPSNLDAADAQRTEAAPASTLATLRRALCLLRYDWRSLVGSALCALVFGSAVGSSALALDGADLAVQYAGRLVGTGALLAAVARQAVDAASDRLSGIVLAAVALGVLSQPVSSVSAALSLTHALPSASQALLVGLLFVETQSTSRELPRPAVLAHMSLIAFLLAWLLGCAASLALSNEAIETVAHVLFIGCLCALVASATRVRARSEAGDVESDGDPGLAAEDAAGRTPDRGAGDYAALVRGISADMAAAYGLSERESEILPMLAVGLSAPSIAERLFISPHTVKTYTHRIYTKAGVHSHAELIALFEKHAQLR